MLPNGGDDGQLDDPLFVKTASSAGGEPVTILTGGCPGVSTSLAEFGVDVGFGLHNDEEAGTGPTDRAAEIGHGEAGTDSPHAEGVPRQRVNALSLLGAKPSTAFAKAKAPEAPPPKAQPEAPPRKAQPATKPSAPRKSSGKAPVQPKAKAEEKAGEKSEPKKRGRRPANAAAEAAEPEAAEQTSSKRPRGGAKARPSQVVDG